MYGVSRTTPRKSGYRTAKACFRFLCRQACLTGLPPFLPGWSPALPGCAGKVKSYVWCFPNYTPKVRISECESLLSLSLPASLLDGFLPVFRLGCRYIIGGTCVKRNGSELPNTKRRQACLRAERTGRPPHSESPDIGLRKLAFAFSAGKLACRGCRCSNLVCRYIKSGAGLWHNGSKLPHGKRWPRLPRQAKRGADRKPHAHDLQTLLHYSGAPIFPARAFSPRCPGKAATGSCRLGFWPWGLRPYPIETRQLPSYWYKPHCAGGCVPYCSLR